MMPHTTSAALLTSLLLLLAALPSQAVLAVDVSILPTDMSIPLMFLLEDYSRDAALDAYSRATTCTERSNALALLGRRQLRGIPPAPEGGSDPALREPGS